MNFKSQQTITPTRLTKPRNHYINNKKFLDAFIKYQNEIKRCQENNLTVPAIPNYIGECILLLANKLAQKSNFCNYPFKEEMISDGIENTFLYLHSFNPEKYDNPFAYFTEIIKNAFIRRIQKERKQTYIIHKITEFQTYSNLRTENPSEMNDDDFVESYENMLSEKRRKAKDRQKEKKMAKDENSS